MATGEGSSGLRGRRAECDALDRLVATATSGQSQVLVLRGQAGIGKSAMLRYVSANAPGCRIERAVGVQSEMELAFAAVHQLCAPMLDHLDGLPSPQRDALATAFGMHVGSPPDRFLVALATLSLLSSVAERQPLVCLVDDAQWLDRASAQTLAFVARRLLAEPIALVFASREPEDGDDLAGLPTHEVGALRPHDARKLLDSVVGGPIDQGVRDQIIAEARGNPLALLEFARWLTAAELAFGLGPPDATPVASRVEQGFIRRLESLPVDSRRLVLTAALDPVGDVSLLWRAAERLGIGPQAAEPAQSAGLLDFGVRVQFAHPLVRSAAHRAALLADHHAVHLALAEATDPEADPDRRAWHRAQATTGRDEDVAAELERCAERARGRGGLAATAAFLERATELTPDDGLRARRALAAAQAKLQAGAFDSASRLLTESANGPPDELRQARIDLLRAQIAFASDRGSEAAPLLLAAARRFAPLDASLSRASYLQALLAAIFAGRFAKGIDLSSVAQAAREAPPSTDPSRSDLLLDALAVLLTDGYQAAAPALKEALSAFCRESGSVDDDLPWLWLVAATAADHWDDDSWHTVAVRHTQAARASGAFSELPLALSSRAFVHLFSGELSEAAALVEEVEAVRGVTGSSQSSFCALGLSAWRGREVQASAAIASTISEVTSRGEGIGLTVAQWASAVLNNGLGRHEEAFDAARRATGDVHELGVSKWALTELVEAAARTGRAELAADALEQLLVLTAASGTDWALGVAARTRAMIAEGSAAEAHHHEAIARLGRTRVKVELARAHLGYGEWLNRVGRRVDARQQLLVAHDMFTSAGIEAFAERARRELQVAGEVVHRPSVETFHDLTAQEAHIARLAATGLTNPEIASQLFISPRTVEYHLRKVFTKIGVTSRRELRRALPNFERISTVA